MVQSFTMRKRSYHTSRTLPTIERSAESHNGLGTFPFFVGNRSRRGGESVAVSTFFAVRCGSATIGTAMLLETKEETMIRGVHTMFYSSQPEELRAFLRDKLDFPYSDVGDGWLIFDLPEADMGCHPADPSEGALSGTHDISFYCDDIEKTVAELRFRGVEFTDQITDRGYGLVTHFKLPGDFAVQLYQPRYTKHSDARREV
jgi:catechol 2,3-dioxygenase-like lactoylglutathione lyase family enzyme